jgi:hypothetical protein
MKIRDFSLSHDIKIVSGANPASYSVGIEGCFREGKAARA